MTVAVCAILGLILAAGIYSWASHRASTATRFELQVTAPATDRFDDDNFSNMSGPPMPEPNNNRKLAAAAPLVISYNLTSGQYAPVFRMNLSADEINNAVKITPFIRGRWVRDGDSAISFRPENSWPADQKFSVKINRNIFNPDIRVNDDSTSFKTPDITAKIDSFALYPQQNTKSVMGVAIISFNYAIDTKKFADRITMRIDGKNIDFTVKFDRFHRTAFVTSAPIAITNNAQVLRLKLNKIPAAAGDAATEKITASATIDAADNMFKISELTTTVADDTNGLPQQLILLNTTTAAAADTDFDKFIQAYLLPRDKDDNDTEAPHKWMPDEITPDVIKKSKKLALKHIDFSAPAGLHQYAFSYDVSEHEDRFIYVSVAPNMMSAAGFAMRAGDARVMAVPYPARRVQIAGDGALLAMGGERKLGISARGGADAAYINLYKVKATEINHLISQTYGLFSSVDFKSWSFGAYDMSVVFKKTIPFSNTSMKAVNYASVDLGDYLDRTHADKTGIFIVQAAASQNQADYSDMRLILLTDLGIIRKVNLDETSTVFISNLSGGGAAADTEVYVLGRNGNAVWAGRTDDGGRAEIPALPWREYRNEKQPVAIVARRGDDVSFIPYDAYDRQVEYSKFDIDGEYASAISMNAYVFSDRGIYRPGETAIIGTVVKNRNFKQTAGIPVRMEILDSRGRVTMEKTLSLPTDGMFDVKFAVAQNAPLGEYYAKIFSLTPKNKTKDFLGQTTFRVEEFVPDTLKISANILGGDTVGWQKPENMTASVSLRNMFATPATDKRISARVILSPAAFKFDNLPGYVFSSGFISGTGLSERSAEKSRTFELPDTTTDADGNATLDIKLENADELPGTYNMTLIVQGFEGGAGRGVQTAATSRVSNAKYLIGYKTNSDLSYINRGAAHKLYLVAVDHTGNTTSASDLNMRLIKRENLTSLIKDYNDTYKYQTITRDRVILNQNITIEQRGTEINLDTAAGGTYFIQITDAGDKILANIEYFVASDENTALHTDSQAELQIKLNASQYAPGDDIAVNITAPYSGTGLITIERDRVYAYRWFQATAATSTQHIKVPENFEGTGYINVSFVRDINSRDIFTTPYAYAVAPFTADVARRTIGVHLQAPDIIRDNKLTIEYKTDQDARLMIFATNNGILQVAKYKLPNPIAHFFQKAALQVNTYQILSLLLPEYKVLNEFAKTGGGDYEDTDAGAAGLTNPFGRRLQAPLAFYSEILNAKANTPATITFDIPDSFNGEIKIYAVAANNSGAGSAATEARVQSPIIISANAPLFAAPGDTFSVNAVITNLMDNVSADTINASASATGAVELTTDAAAKLNIANNTEKLWTIDARATDAIGASEINITASYDDTTHRNATATMSVRPTTPFTTLIKTGTIDGKGATIRPNPAPMYSQLQTSKLYATYNADAFIRPLVEYLRSYPFTCTEQTVSRAMPYAIIGASDILNITSDDAAAQRAAAISVLKNRQNPDGSFAMWPDNHGHADNARITAWAVQFLTIARANGFDVPRDMLTRALDYLRTYAGGNIKNEQDAATHAFAIYVITANEYVTTAYINTFEEFANSNIKGWESKLMGAYIAAAYKLMHQDDRADTLIRQYKSSARAKFEYQSDFDNNVANDAIYQYLSHRHFDTPALSPNDAISAYINSGDYTSYTSAAVIMGMSGNTGRTSAVQISADIDGTAAHGTISSDGGFIMDIPRNAKKITLKCSNCDNDDATVFWTMIQQGYPLQSKEAQNGIDVVREYYNADGQRITSGKIGDTVTIKIFARTRGDVSNITNAAIVDMMPGGFIADTDSITGPYDFAEVREDRAIIYTTLTRDALEFTYTAQLGAAGTFAIAPVHAQSMYNPALNSTGAAGTFTVEDGSAK